MNDTELAETEFQRLADATLARLAEALEQGLADAAEVELQGGILTIDLDAGGQYVINKHAPNRQIWLSSPRSGASHYAFDAARGTWVATRSGRTLADVLTEELRPLASGPLVLGAA
jgi:frataxin